MTFSIDRSKSPADWWEAYKSHFGKTYASTALEAQRRQAFWDAVVRTDAANRQHQRDHGTQVWGITKFSDLTPHEFYQKNINPHAAAFTKPQAKPQTRRLLQTNPPLDLAAAVDWSAALTPIKNQGNCSGGGWAFAAVEAIESSLYLSTGHQFILSTQQLLDCDEYDRGCLEGWQDGAFDWLQLPSHALTTEANYPYTSGMTGTAGTCHTNGSNVAYAVDSTDPTPFCGSRSGPDPFFVPCNETALQIVVANGPALGVVNKGPWQDYTGGIVESGCSDDWTYINDVAQFIGYGANFSFWHLRNSWGKDWGENGTIRLAMGSNLCGLANQVSSTSAQLLTPLPRFSSSSSSRFSSSSSSRFSSSSSSMHPLPTGAVGLTSMQRATSSSAASTPVSSTATAALSSAAATLSAIAGFSSSSPANYSQSQSLTGLTAYEPSGSSSRAYWLFWLLALPLLGIVIAGAVVKRKAAARQRRQQDAHNGGRDGNAAGRPGAIAQSAIALACRPRAQKPMETNDVDREESRHPSISQPGAEISQPGQAIGEV